MFLLTRLLECIIRVAWSIDSMIIELDFVCDLFAWNYWISTIVLVVYGQIVNVVAFYGLIIYPYDGFCLKLLVQVLAMYFDVCIEISG